MGRHKEWRKVAKKMRRKRIRSAAAAQRDKDEKLRMEKISSTPYYKEWLAEQEALELFKEQEEKRASILAHQKWEFMETLAQERWVKQQKLRMEEEEKRKEQEAMIKREWEREQEKERKEKEEREKDEQRKREAYERLIEEMNSFIEGSGAMPESLHTHFDTNPEREPCPFYSKVGACRFKDSCSRNHRKPGISNTVLLPGFYTHFTLEVSGQGEYDTDLMLEFDSSERNRDFREFFADVAPELEKFGRILQLRVCSNTEPHLRGNVYVAYSNEREAAAACKALNGRYYAGRMLHAEFVHIPSWRNALCGLQFRGSCPKGSKCNFLHVFRNPNNLYSERERPRESNDKATPSRDDWRWTPSPPHRSHRDEGSTSRHERSRERRDSWTLSPPDRSHRDEGSTSRHEQSRERRDRSGRSSTRRDISSERRDRTNRKFWDHSERRRRGSRDRSGSRSERRYSDRSSRNRKDRDERTPRTREE